MKKKKLFSSRDFSGGALNFLDDMDSSVSIFDEDVSDWETFESFRVSSSFEGVLRRLEVTGSKFFDTKMQEKIKLNVKNEEDDKIFNTIILLVRNEKIESYYGRIFCKLKNRKLYNLCSPKILANLMRVQTCESDMTSFYFDVPPEIKTIEIMKSKKGFVFLKMGGFVFFWDKTNFASTVVPLVVCNEESTAEKIVVKEKITDKHFVPVTIIVKMDIYMLEIETPSFNKFISCVVKLNKNSYFIKGSFDSISFVVTALEKLGCDDKKLAEISNLILSS